MTCRPDGGLGGRRGQAVLVAERVRTPASHRTGLRLSGGADLQVVKERLGHSTIATTEKYLHALPDTDETAIEALDKYRNGKPADELASAKTEIERLRATVLTRLGRDRGRVASA